MTQLVQLTEINGHCEKDDKSKVCIKHRKEVEDSNDNVDDGRCDAEDDVVQQTVDTVCATVNHTQHLAGLTTKMPT